MSLTPPDNLHQPRLGVFSRLLDEVPAAERYRLVTEQIAHAEAQGLAIDWRATTAEALAAEGLRFDVVVAMEIVEHVADLLLFLREIARLVRPGGLLCLATLNRTAKSFALAIVGAEYVLRWLPPGTHTWSKFVTPRELERAVEATGLSVLDACGMVFDPLRWSWDLKSGDLDVNYLMLAERPA